MRRYRIRRALVLLALSSISLPFNLESSEWPRFRGPDGSGINSQARDLPIEFDATQSVVWKLPLPFSRSSPVLAGNLIFLTAVEKDKLVTLCVDATTGKTRWRREMTPSRAQGSFTGNDAASATPTTDGENVYVFFSDSGLVSYDLAGEERWRLPLGPFENFYGISASPILSGDTLIMQFDQVTGSFIVGVDKNRGTVRWKTTRQDRIESWSSPVLYRPSSGGTHVITHGSWWVDAYSVETGTLVWQHPGVGAAYVSSPVVSGHRVYVSVPNHGNGGATRPTFDSLLEAHDQDGDGKLTEDELMGHSYADHFGWRDRDSDGILTALEFETLMNLPMSKDFGLVAIDVSGDAESAGKPSTLWRFTKSIPYMATPLVHDGVVYMVRPGGIFTTVDSSTGEMLKRGRIPDGGGQYFSSPVMGDGKLYVASDEGKVVVIKAAADWEVLAVNDLEEEIYATPAIAPGRIFIRTRGHLYAFGTKKVTGEARRNKLRKEWERCMVLPPSLTRARQAVRASPSESVLTTALSTRVRRPGDHTGARPRAASVSRIVSRGTPTP